MNKGTRSSHSGSVLGGQELSEKHIGCVYTRMVGKKKIPTIAIIRSPRAVKALAPTNVFNAHLSNPVLSRTRWQTPVAAEALSTLGLPGLLMEIFSNSLMGEFLQRGSDPVPFKVNGNPPVDFNGHYIRSMNRVGEIHTPILAPLHQIKGLENIKMLQKLQIQTEENSSSRRRQLETVLRGTPPSLGVGSMLGLGLRSGL